MKTLATTAVWCLPHNNQLCNSIVSITLKYDTNTEQPGFLSLTSTSTNHLTCKTGTQSSDNEIRTYVKVIGMLRVEVGPAALYYIAKFCSRRSRPKSEFSHLQAFVV